MERIKIKIKKLETPKKKKKTLQAETQNSLLTVLFFGSRSNSHSKVTYIDYM